MAMVKDDVESLKILVKYQKNVNIRDGEGLTLLHTAGLRGAAASTKLLLSHGAKVNALCPHYKGTPLDYATSGRFQCHSRKSDFKQVEKLLRAKGGKQTIAN